MENNKKNAIKQYFKYFKVWFILLGIVAIIFALLVLEKNISSVHTRTNNQAPEERVYDNADVLTDEEEQELRNLIARKENELGIDFVLVTIREDIEKDNYNWDDGMMNYADDFYDYNNYGFDMPMGDGVLLLDNWYEGQSGSWLSTCGKVYRQMNNQNIDLVLDEVYYKVERDPYSAYKAYIQTVAIVMGERADMGIRISPNVMIFLPIAVSLIFILIKLFPTKGRVTTDASTYIPDGRVKINAKSDTFVREYVTTRRIETSNDGGYHGGGAGRSGGGGGGHHISSSGTTHGGGGRRR